MSAQPPKKSGYTLRIVLMGVLLALLANLVLIAMISPKPPPETEAVAQAMQLLRDAHVARPQRERLAENAVAGMANGLGDPYTQFFPQDEAAAWSDRLHSDGELRPLAPTAAPLAAPEAWMMDPAHGIGYAALGRFGDRSSEALERALSDLKAGHMNGLILDLRGNPGGFLAQARDMAGLFLPKGSVVAKVKGPSIPEKILRTEKPPATDVPLVVLIDAGSASAAEVLAGALQEHGRALIVGTRSFGKGCVQSVRDLDELHGKLKITTGYYFLPSGRCIHRGGQGEWGVAPSPGAQVRMSPADAKQWAATRKLAPSLHPLADAKAEISADFLREKLHDAPLAAAHAALLGKISTGAWPRVGDDPAPASKDDPHWRAREEIKELEARLRQLRRDMANLAPASAQP